MLWICHDTPIRDGVPNPEWVMGEIRAWMGLTHTRTLVLVSSQMPVGTIKRLETEFPRHTFAYSPENLRVKTAVDDFQGQRRVVVGTRQPSEYVVNLLTTVFKPFTRRIMLMSPESAEMVKHALNGFLGLQIAYINEIARVCEVVGADAEEVAEALLCERRISPHAPLKPGAPFGGGHLTRDILTLIWTAKDKGIPIPIIAHILESNEVVRV